MKLWRVITGMFGVVRWSAATRSDHIIEWVAEEGDSPDSRTQRRHHEPHGALLTSVGVLVVAINALGRQILTLFLPSEPRRLQRVPMERNPYVRHERRVRRPRAGPSNHTW